MTIFLPIEKIPTLNDFDKQLCEDNLQIEDIARALRELPNDKTPGSDGFTTNFYKFFWPDIKNLLFNSFKFSFDNGELSNDQKRGILNLIPKEGKDIRLLRNWRPISRPGASTSTCTWYLYLITLFQVLVLVLDS